MPDCHHDNGLRLQGMSRLGKFARAALALHFCTVPIGSVAGTGSPLPNAGGPAAVADRLWMDFEGPIDIVEGQRGQTAALVMGGRPWPAPREAAAGTGRAAIGQPIIQFQGGNPSQRSARVVDDPGRAGNRVLEFALRESNVSLRDRPGAKSRIQMNVYGNSGVAELYQSVRLRLGPDFDLLKQYPGVIDWFTISEWWNNAGWTKEPYPFRISVHLRKTRPEAGQPLYVVVKATSKQPGGDAWTTKVWESADTTLPIPVNQWMLIEYYVKEGNRENGRFVVAVTPDGGTRRIVTNVSGFTQHPQDPRPDGLSHINPVKLYTSEALTQFMHRSNAAFTMYWDDLDIQVCNTTTTGEPSACAIRHGLR